IDPDLGAVADRDAGRFLAPVLQREQPQIGHVRDRLGGLRGGPDSEDAAGFPKLVRTRLHAPDDTASPAAHPPVTKVAGWVSGWPDDRTDPAAEPGRAAEHHPDGAQAARPEPTGTGRADPAMPADRAAGPVRIEPAGLALAGDHRPRPAPGGRPGLPAGHRA